MRKHNYDLFHIPSRIEIRSALKLPNLDDLADTENPRKEKKILAAWSGSDIEWLLSEDKEMAEEARRMAMESLDAKATN